VLHDDDGVPVVAELLEDPDEPARFAAAAAGTYTSDEAARGGIWKGKQAIVVRVDTSGTVEKCTTDFKVFGPTGAASPEDIFVPSATWLGPTQLPLNPAP
jgi:hypothetical protein